MKPFVRLLCFLCLFCLFSLSASPQVRRLGQVPRTCNPPDLFAKYDTSTGTWKCDPGPTGGTNHAILSATHSDTTAAAVARGDLMTAQGVTPTWSRLAVALAGRYLRSDGTDLSYSSIAAAGAGSCTNQFVRATNDNAAPTCSTVGNADLAAGAVDSAKLASANKTFEISYTFFDLNADLPATLDIPSIYPNRARAITLTEVYCEIDAGSASINLQRDDGTPANILSADLACSTAGATSTGFAAGEAAIAIGHNLDHVTVSVGAGLRRLNVAIKYTVD